MADNSLISLLVAGGGGSVIGSGITAFIQSWGHKGEARATAADISVNVAGRMIQRLDAENKAMREAIILITNSIDEIIDEDSGFNDVTKHKLRKLTKAAREALSVMVDSDDKR